jgi:ribonuclease HI
VPELQPHHLFGRGGEPAGAERWLIVSALADLLRFIAANEDLPRTMKRYPGYDRDTLGKLIHAAAERLEEGDRPPDGARAAAKGGLKVRKASEVERQAQKTAEELDAAMNESKVDRERKRASRAEAAAVEREVARAETVAGPVRTRLFVDGAARGNPGPAGAGAVIVSPEGHIQARVGKFLGESTNNVAEYMGLILGLKRAKAMGIKELDVLADSELVVKQLAGDYAVKAEHLRPLHDEAKQLLAGFSVANVRHVPREENKLADEMSNRAIDERL